MNLINNYFEIKSFYKSNMVSLEKDVEFGKEVIFGKQFEKYLDDIIIFRSRG
jgi:hypothetical protein